VCVCACSVFGQVFVCACSVLMHVWVGVCVCVGKGVIQLEFSYMQCMHKNTDVLYIAMTAIVCICIYTVCTYKLTLQKHRG